jgi:peptide/nickel transport system ATP-binding protein
MESNGPLLELKKLTTVFPTRRGVVTAVADVSLAIQRGEILGIVGESGCGKSMTMMSILRLVSSPGRTVSGEVLFEGRDLLRLSGGEMRRVRGKEIAMVFQDPLTSLNPAFPVGEQIRESLRIHHILDEGRPLWRLGRGNAQVERERVYELLAEVGISSPADRFREYPYQFSGGMQQRALIAVALACQPKLLLADEPTTSLDVTIQAQIIDLLLELSERTGTALLFITHDLGVIAETCTRMLTMYAGQVVEDAPVDSALVRPRHPYTSGLLRSLPRLSARGAVLPSIAGRVPTLRDMPTGCRFAERCPHARDECAAPQAIEPAGGHLVRCCRHGELVLPGALTDREAAA